MEPDGGEVEEGVRGGGQVPSSRSHGGEGETASGLGPSLIVKTISFWFLVHFGSDSSSQRGAWKF